MDANKEKFDRREFIGRCVSGAAVAGIAGLGAYGLLDKNGPPAQLQNVRMGLSDYSVPQVPGQVISAVKSPLRQAAVEKAIDMLGGIERFIKPGDVVLVKPNVAFASSPVLGATTHPDTLSTIIKLCYDRGRAKQVFVTDNPINDPQSCFTFSGIGKAASDAGAKVLLPKESLFEPVSIEGASLIQKWPVLTGSLEGVTKLIGVSPLKDHHRSGASMTMKNWYGLLGGQRGLFHQQIHQIITELAMMVKPTFVVLDGSMAMKSNGPTGGSVEDLIKTDTVIASTDMVAADTYGAGLLGMDISKLAYIVKAEREGIGSMDYRSLGIKEAGV